jgi:hypothetical protein
MRVSSGLAVPAGTVVVATEATAGGAATWDGAQQPQGPAAGRDRPGDAHEIEPKTQQDYLHHGSSHRKHQAYGPHSVISLVP